MKFKKIKNTIYISICVVVAPCHCISRHTSTYGHEQYRLTCAAYANMPFQYQGDTANCGEEGTG